MSDSRRLLQSDEYSLRAEDLIQVIDVDLGLRGDAIKELPNMPNYPVRSLDNALGFLADLAGYGIRRVTVRMGGSRESAESGTYSFDPLFIGTEEKYRSMYPDHRFDEGAANGQFDAYARIRDEFGANTLEIIADPFGIAPNPDGSWGVTGANGAIDVAATNAMTRQVATGYAAAGVHGMLTMGRIDGEVAAGAGLSGHPDFRILSFSQNMESKTAYIYLDEIDSRRDTGQKILPGNSSEMKLRTILDLHEGADVVVVKPAESYHMVSYTAQLLAAEIDVKSFLCSDIVATMAAAAPSVRVAIDEIMADLPAFEAKLVNARVATYSVSGSYYLAKLLHQAKGAEFEYNYVFESWKALRSAAGDKYFGSIDRNALWLLRHWRARR
ncbi:hypothetical protein V7968_37660 [Nocardia vulneris]|uniref:hypothetical protein n=1 Tax=Nocardia vulneris TaxID=1141657 RepID=UPI0030CC4D85